MIRAARVSRDELSSKYGLSERLTVRILALASKGLGVTGAVLEEAVRLPAVADARLSPEILERAGGLDTGAVRRIGPGGKTLAVVKGVLCLEEEVQAEDTEENLPAVKTGGERALKSPSGLDAEEM